MPEPVECHSGFAYAEKPVALTWQGTRREVRHILSQWRSPQGRNFRVETENGQVFELIYNEATDEWQITESNVS
ncbi:MAG: hypothetical protein AB1846_08030 [Chloroflexota bacterium]